MLCHDTVIQPLRWFWKGDGPVFWMKDDNFGNHLKVSDEDYRRWRGSFVGFFRNPELRAQSAYDHFGHDQTANGTRVTEAEFARRIRGSQTTMLSGQAHAPLGTRTTRHMHMLGTCYAHARRSIPGAC